AGGVEPAGPGGAVKAHVPRVRPGGAARLPTHAEDPCIRTRRDLWLTASKQDGLHLQTVSLGDDLLHDLVRAGADAPQTRVPPGPLDGELVHVSMPAEDLDRVVRHVARGLRRA